MMAVAVIVVSVVIMSMVVVAMAVAVVAGVEAFLAVEDQEVHAERVQRGHEHTDQHGIVREACAPDVSVAGGFDDVFLRVETREKRRADQGQRAQQEGDPGDGHVLAQAAHVADVLGVVQADDDRTRAQEQQRLEERVGHQVEDRHRVGRCAERNRHVTQLRQRGVRDDALDVGLDDAQDAQEQCADGADHNDERQRHVRQFKQRRKARDHEDAGRHHGGGVDQRGDRGRAFHRIHATVSSIQSEPGSVIAASLSAWANTSP
ncbi:hypothetical protein G6F57_018296 [Rhizopus arrhizus]|nr:hypothetical protein G6F57_018296 [Rhizopus arrhizus]